MIVGCGEKGPAGDGGKTSEEKAPEEAGATVAVAADSIDAPKGGLRAGLHHLPRKEWGRERGTQDSIHRRASRFVYRGAIPEILRRTAWGASG